MTAAAPRVLAIIVNYNGGHWVVDAAGSLVAQDLPTDVLVVDNDSTDGSVAALRATYPSLNVIETGENLGSVAGYNYALKYPEYDFYVFLNPDAVAPSDMNRNLVAILDAHPDIAILGPAIMEYDLPHLIQAFAPTNDFFQFPFDRWEGEAATALPDVDVFPTGYACAACIICRGDVYRELEGMEELFFMFTEEPDLSWRARLLGYETAVTPRVRVRHVGGIAAVVGNDNGAYVTSLRRIYLRERNSIMMAMKCFALPSLVVYGLAYGSLLLCEALVLIAMGRAEIARTYWEAARDAVRHWPRLRDKRRQIQETRRLSEWGILHRFTPGYAKLRVLLRRGMPRIKDWRRQANA